VIESRPKGPMFVSVETAQDTSGLIHCIHKWWFIEINYTHLYTILYLHNRSLPRLGVSSMVFPMVFLFNSHHHSQVLQLLGLREVHALTPEPGRGADADPVWQHGGLDATAWGRAKGLGLQQHGRHLRQETHDERMTHHDHQVLFIIYPISSYIPI